MALLPQRHLTRLNKAHRNLTVPVLIAQVKHRSCGSYLGYVAEPETLSIGQPLP